MNADTSGNGLVDRYLGRASAGNSAGNITGNGNGGVAALGHGSPTSSFDAGERYVPMLSLELLGGDRIALPYSMLLSVKLDPSAGIELEFSTVKVRITGRRLDDLYTAIVQHRAGRVRCEHDDRFETTTGGVTAITLESSQD